MGYNTAWLTILTIIIVVWVLFWGFPLLTREKASSADAFVISPEIPRFTGFSDFSAPHIGGVEHGPIVNQLPCNNIGPSEGNTASAMSAYTERSDFL